MPEPRGRAEGGRAPFGEKRMGRAAGHREAPCDLGISPYPIPPARFPPPRGRADPPGPAEPAGAIEPAGATGPAGATEPAGATGPT